MTKKTAVSQEAGSVNNIYELMLILNPDLRESDIKKKLKELVDMVEKAGGRLTHEDFWGKRPLVYKIKKQAEGIYMVYNFELPGQFLAELKNHLRIEKEILRSMIIKLPAGHTYTKYDLTADEPKPKKERDFTKKNVSIKHNSPIIHSKKKAEKADEPASEKSESPKKFELDKKLDQILGGEDLKL